MTRKALVVKAARRQAEYDKAIKAGKKPKFSTRVYNRCKLTWRRHWFLRLFGISRIMFRKLASEWKLPGVTKSSW